MSELNKFDPTRFVVSEDADIGAIGVERRLTIAVRKPNKQEYFRAHPKLQMTVPLLEIKEERQSYILTPDIANGLPGDYAIRTLSLCVSRQGNLFLWPLPVLAQDGRAPLAWHESAIAAHKQAIDSWTRMAANMSAGEYDIYRASLDLTPNWRGLNEDMGFILETAFGEQCVIDSPNHPVVRMLQGRA